MIRAKVVETEERRVTAEVKKSLKQLAHLPTASLVTFVEVSMKELVSDAVWSQHKDQFRSRARRRKDAARRDRKYDHQQKLRAIEQ